MGILNPNSTSYVHPNEPNVSRIENAMAYNNAGEPVLRARMEGVTINGPVTVDAVRIWDGSHYVSLDEPSNDNESPSGIWAFSTENYNMVFNGTTWDRMRGNTTTGVLVQVSNFPSTQTVTVSNGSIVVSNFTSTVHVDNFTSTVTVSNFPTSVTVTNFTSTVQVSNNVTATITSMPAITGTATVYQGTTPWIVKQQNTATDIVIADSNYELNLARGLVDSQYVEMKNGYAPSLSPGSGANEPTVWGLNTPYPWSSWGNGHTLWIVSDNATDIGQQVYIDGLNSSYAKINETVTLNGTTGTQTTSTFLRINHFYMITGNSNAGGISARVGNATTGTQVAYMISGNARGKGGFFTVPAGYSAYILYGDCASYKNGSGNVSGQVDMYTRTPNLVTTPFMNQFAAVVANGQYRNEFNVPLRVPEKTDIDVRFDASGNATTVSVNWEMILIPN